MSLSLIRKYIQHGLYNEARRLIDIESDINFLMHDEPSDHRHEQFSDRVEESLNSKLDKTPLLIILVFIKDEGASLALSQLLLEKGYRLDVSDSNGLCAMNYAIALNRVSLVKLYLNLFNVELNEHRDSYRNSFLHYVFAMNNLEVISEFARVYSKFYDWNKNLFVSTKNIDGLSIQDLFAYSMLKNQKNFKIRTDITNLPEYFKSDSNPIKICSFIDKVYHSNSTIKSELLYMSNMCRQSSAQQKLSTSVSLSSIASNQIQFNKNQQKNRRFKLNILLQIRAVTKRKPLNMDKFGDFNEIIEKNLLEYRNNRVSPIISEFHNGPTRPARRAMSSKMNLRGTVGLDFLASPVLSRDSICSIAKNEACWKTEIKRIYIDYEIINSLSYCKPAVPMICYDESFATDFTKDGSEFGGSQINSDFNAQSNGNDFLNESSKSKIKKNLMELKTQRSADSSSSSVNKQAKEGAKNFRILKTKSIDVKDQEENELSSNDGSLVPEKQRVAKLVRKKSLGQTSDSSETSVTATAAKIVKPSGPSKWSGLKEKTRSPELRSSSSLGTPPSVDFTVNAHDL